MMGKSAAPVLPKSMRAMVLNKPGQALQLIQRPLPRPAAHELLLAVEACGVCRTDLHIIDGDLPTPRLPLILEHEIVGVVVSGGIHMSDIPSFPYYLL
jgi:propanol-preferring alcohol dehydrogenase